MDPIDFDSMRGKKTMEVKKLINCLVLFCVHQKTDIHTGLKQLEGE